MTLAELTLEAILSLNRPAAAPHERLRAVAEDIAFVAKLADGAPFTGPARIEAAALALAAIADHESGFQERVLDCLVTGDRLDHHGPSEGRSITIYMLMRPWAWDGHSRAEICSGGPLAPWLSLRVLRTHGARCTMVVSWFYGYASGNCGVRSDAGMRQCHTLERLARFSGIQVSCWGRGEATYAPPASTEGDNA